MARTGPPKAQYASGAMLGLVARPSLAPRSLVTLVLGILAVIGCAGVSPYRAGNSLEALPTGLVGPVAPTVGPGALRFVVLGDSYPFGDGVAQADRWPNQLVRILRPDVDMEVAANLAGRTSATAQVIQNQMPQLVQLEPQFVGVQVGANDAIFGTPPDDYAANMATILDTVLERVHRPDRIVVVTTPDFTLTPDGPSLVTDAGVASVRIRELNGLLREAAASRGIAVVDISPISDRVREDPSLVGLDPVTGRYLHPSAKQYAGWADLVATALRRLYAHPAATDMHGVTSADTPVAPMASSGAPGASVSP